MKFSPVKTGLTGSLLLSQYYWAKSDGFVLSRKEGSSPLTRRNAIIGVADSPIDFSHKDLKNHAWDGFYCDYEDESEKLKCQPNHGKNIIDPSSPEALDPKKSEKYVDVLRFLDIEKRYLSGKRVSQKEATFFNESSKSASFRELLNEFLQNSHGSHVSGIITKDNPKAKVIELRMIPFMENVKGRYAFVPVRNLKPVDSTSRRQVLADLLEYILEDAKNYKEMAEFSKTKNINVVNCSFGKGLARTFVERFLWSKNLIPNDKDVKALEKIYVDKTNKIIGENLSIAQKTLFVAAAGNSHTDLDKEPQAFTSLGLDQFLVVGAVDKEGRMTDFSSYGKNSVEIAAPGFEIESTALGGSNTKMSGTSQAAPHVSRAAALVYDVHSELSPKEIKEILLGSVDHKEHLKSYVTYGGVLNTDQALLAAKRVKEGQSIREACRLSYEAMPE